MNPPTDCANVSPVPDEWTATAGAVEGMQKTLAKAKLRFYNRFL